MNVHVPVCQFVAGARLCEFGDEGAAVVVPAPEDLGIVAHSPPRGLQRGDRRRRTVRLALSARRAYHSGLHPPTDTPKTIQSYRGKFGSGMFQLPGMGAYSSSRPSLSSTPRPGFWGTSM